MDAVGVVGSLVSILQMAVVTTKALVTHAKDTENASRDKKLLTEEASLLAKLLERLQQRAIENQDHSWLGQQVDVVAQLDRAFRDLAKTLNIGQTSSRTACAKLPGAVDHLKRAVQ